MVVVAVVVLVVAIVDVVLDVVLVVVLAVPPVLPLSFAVELWGTGRAQYISVAVRLSLPSVHEHCKSVPFVQTRGLPVMLLYGYQSVSGRFKVVLRARTR